MSKKSYGIVASVLAATLALGAAVMGRAHTVEPASGAGGGATTSSSSEIPTPATNANALGRLLAVSPDGTGAGLPMYTASATVASSYSSWIKSKYPKQAAATQSSSIPATKYWALLIGINDYAGNTADNVGSRQDAQTLQTVLLRWGWRQDHIMLITDRDGTASHIIEGIRWLASKTNSSSTAVFHYAGHENWTRTTADGDNEARDVEIWAADNRNIIDGTLGKEMNRVGAGRMWIDFATCRAAGFSDAGMIKSGRVLTFSSPENEYSYEDPKLHHSVFGWYSVYQAMYNNKGDKNHDGTITVEEAFAYARPAVVSYTNGAQHPSIVDKVSGARMSLRIPPPPKPAPSSSSGGPNPTPSSAVPKTCVVVCF